MVRLLIILMLTYKLTFGQEEVNITSSGKEDNLTSSGSVIHIPSSSEEIDSVEMILEKSKEFNEATTPDIPYLPLIQRCSIDSDCSSETACFDGKCINAKRFQLFPFQRCQNRLDCPSGHRCIISMCIPFRW